jgi:heme-degrading monooxygenase HmoA
MAGAAAASAVVPVARLTPPAPRVYTATFTFAKREFDEAFHALDQTIAQLARSIPGYLGEESWENAASGLICNVYYWESLAALRQLVEHPSHRAAKQRQAQWLAGYRVTIAEVVDSYGDGRVAHPLAGRTFERAGG